MKKLLVLFILVFAQRGLANNSCLSLFFSKPSLEWMDSNSSQKSWENFDATYQRVVSENIKKSQSHYLSALRKQDPYLNFLVAIGYNFSLATVPSFKAIAKAFEGQRIQPAVIFENNQGQRLYIQFGQFIPPGFRPRDSLVGDAEFAAMISKGFFPLGGFRTEIDSRIPLSSLEHDLAHLYVLRKDPVFSQAVQQIFTDIHNSKTDMSPRINPNGSLQYSQRSDRIFYAMEMMTLLPSHHRQNFIDIGLLPNTLNASAYRSITAESIYRHLVKLRNESPQYLDEKTQELLEVFPSLTRSYGGGAADLLSPMRTHVSKVHSSYDSTPIEIYHNLRTSDLYHIYSDGYLKKEARLLSFLWESSWIRPEEWLRQAAEPTLNKESILHRILCKSGFLLPSQHYYKAHCI